MHSNRPDTKNRPHRRIFLSAILAVASAVSACTEVKDPNKLKVADLLGADDFSYDLPFDPGTDSEYIFDSNRIELVGGVARLKVAGIAIEAAVGNASPIQFLVLNDMVETIGTNGCDAGVRYSASTDGSIWFYWDGSDWAFSDGSYAMASPAADFKAGFQTMLTVTQTSLYVRAHLRSDDGVDPCEIEQITITGRQ